MSCDRDVGWEEVRVGTVERRAVRREGAAGTRKGKEREVEGSEGGGAGGGGEAGRNGRGRGGRGGGEDIVREDRRRSRE